MVQTPNGIPVEYVNIARFWSKVDRSSKTGCWPWLGPKKRTGYGLFSISVMTKWGSASLQKAAHRVSYTLTHGPIPQNMEVMHSCDNPPCVRPNHLSRGTKNDNIADRVTKGRSKNSAAVKIVATTVRGLKWNMKLTEMQVFEIRTQYARDTSVTAALLARRYKSCVPNIISILTGATRKTAGGPLSKIRRCVGEARSNSVLTENTVRAIRREYARRPHQTRWTRRKGATTMAALAAKHSTSFQQISAIVSRKIWRHVI